jgi:hypothetical protein
VVAQTVAYGHGEPELVTARTDGAVWATELVSGEDREVAEGPLFAIGGMTATHTGSGLVVAMVPGPDGRAGRSIAEAGQISWVWGNSFHPRSVPDEGALDPVLFTIGERSLIAWINGASGRLLRADVTSGERVGAPVGGADSWFERLLVGGPPGAAVLVTRSPTGLIERWSPETGAPLPGVVVPDGSDTELLATTDHHVVIGSRAGTMSRFELSDAGLIGDPVTVPASPVVSLAAAEHEGRFALAAVDHAGHLWAWTDPPAGGTPHQPPLKAGRTPLVHDQPAFVDELGRENLAKELAGLLRDLATAPDRPEAFALHLDAPWGAGKTTLVRFVADELRNPQPAPDATTPPVWTTVELDAWRSSQLSPAWWALLSHLRRGVREPMGFWRRRRFDLRHLAREAGRLWRVWVPAALVVAALIVLWSVNADVSATMAAVTTVVAFVAGVGGLGSRLFSLGSIQGARLHERLNDHPMEAVAEEIRWVRTQSDRPILLVIDDLDRCNERFAVELLDAVQTLLRSPVRAAQQSLSQPTIRQPLSLRRQIRKPLPALVVLAVGDHRWLRAAYEHAYAVFSPYVSEPGRPLGHLFLDKLFQVRIELPHLGHAQVESYVASLLRVGPDAPAPSADVDAEADAEAIEARIRAAPRQAGTGAHSLDDSMSELLAETTSLSPERRQSLTGIALEVRRTDPLREQRERHLLEQYAGLLEPNPRAAKRFLMAYNLAYAARLAELEPIDSQTLALWVVVTTRWPALADWVRDQLPDGPLQPTGEPAHPSRLLGDPEVQRVVKSTLGGPLDLDKLLRCAGYAPVSWRGSVDGPSRRTGESPSN